MIGTWIDGLSKVLAIKDLNKLPEWAVVGAAVVTGVLALRAINSNEPPRDGGAG